MEVAAKFLELSSLSDKLQAALPSEMTKKRKRKAKSDTSCPLKRKQDPFATYAAELQIDFFKKACECIFFLMH